jgi:uncharacterized protein YjgD (DUF1641 family)
MLQNYSQEVLDIFLNAIKGDKKAFKALMTTEKRPELAALLSAIKGDETAEMWLKARVSLNWWLVCRALDYDENALKKLQQNDDMFYMSFVLACQNRIEGKYWLKKNGYERFFPICEAIAEVVNTRDKRQTLHYDIFRW